MGSGVSSLSASTNHIMRTILYHYIQTGRPPVPVSSELQLKTNSSMDPYLSNLFLKESTESASTAQSGKLLQTLTTR